MDLGLNKPPRWTHRIVTSRIVTSRIVTSRIVRRWVGVIVISAWALVAGQPAAASNCEMEANDTAALVSAIEEFARAECRLAVVNLVPGAAYEFSGPCDGCGDFGLPQIGNMSLLVQGNNAILRPAVTDPKAESIQRATGFGLIQVASLGSLTLDNVTVAGFSHTAVDGDAAIVCTGCTKLVISGSKLDSNTGNGVGVVQVTAGSSIEVDIVNSQISNNISQGSRGAVVFMSVSGDLAVSNTIFSNNRQTGQGNLGSGSGTALYVRPHTATGSTEVAITGSTFAYNAGESFGGALLAIVDGTESTTVKISDSAFFSNQIQANVGSAIYAQAGFGGGSGSLALDIDNSTFTENLGGSQEDGAIFARGQTAAVTIKASTLANNTGGALGTQTMATVSIQDSIVVGSQLCNGSVTSSGHNMIEGEVCGFDATKNDQSCSTGEPDTCGLTPLANHGGPTQTIAILPNSAAVGNASCANDQCSRGRDARGVVRSTSTCGSGATCDIGAYQRIRQPLCRDDPCTQEIRLVVDFAQPDFDTGFPVLNAPGQPDTISCTANIVQWKIVPFRGAMPESAEQLEIENIFFSAARLFSIRLISTQGEEQLGDRLREDQSMELCLFKGLPALNEPPEGAPPEETAEWLPNIDGWVLYQIGTSEAPLNRRGECGPTTSVSECFEVPVGSDPRVSDPWSYSIVWRAPVTLRDFDPRMDAEVHEDGG